MWPKRYLLLSLTLLLYCRYRPKSAFSILKITFEIIKIGQIDMILVISYSNNLSNHKFKVYLKKKLGTNLVTIVEVSDEKLTPAKIKLNFYFIQGDIWHSGCYCA